MGRPLVVCRLRHWGAPCRKDRASCYPNPYRLEPTEGIGKPMPCCAPQWGQRLWVRGSVVMVTRPGRFGNYGAGRRRVRLRRSDGRAALA